MRFLRDDRGAVTVFTALILSAIVILDSVLYDYISFKGQKALCRDELRLACGSVLASYDSLLAEHYGLYGINTVSAVPPDERFGEYCTAESYSISFSDPYTAPQVLKDQITGIMKIRTPLNITEKLLRVIGVLSDDTDRSGDLSLCAEASAGLAELEKKQKKLKDKVEGLFGGDTACVNGYSLIYPNIAALIADIVHGKPDPEGLIDNVIVLTEQYIRYNSEAAALCNEMNILKSDITSVTDRVSRDSSVYYEAKNIRSRAVQAGNTSFMGYLEENIDTYSRRIGILNDVRSGTADINEIYDAFINESIHTDIHINTSYAGGTGNGSDGRKAIKEELDRLSSSQTASDSYVIPDDIYRTLPSASYGPARDTVLGGISLSLDSFDGFSDILTYVQNMSFRSVLKDIGERILVDDYIMTYMTDRLSGVSNERLNNEIEYIISGLPSASDNNTAVNMRILAIRFAVDFADIMTDAEKCALAEAMAAAIAALVSMGSGTTLFKYIIIAGWAMIDAYNDLDKLLSGGSVPLISLEDTAGGSIDRMQDYSFYLRILLTVTPEKTKLLRICDIIEMNMSDITGQRYRMSGVYGTVRASAVNKLDFVFIGGANGSDLYTKESCEMSY